MRWCRLLLVPVTLTALAVPAPAGVFFNKHAKPNPAERPPSAVEVYLRLQELGKASGILLLPAGAMDKLVAARQAAEPTVEYAPADPKTRTRRIFLSASASGSRFTLWCSAGEVAQGSITINADRAARQTPQLLPRARSPRSISATRSHRASTGSLHTAYR